ncbi:MAG: hypothetical protein IJP62_09575, partial [Treponema sp.]|nr:hypothetical protein [Treponema sp.]
SPEHIAKIVAARKGKKLKPHSPEHNAKISAACSGDKHYFFGKHHTGKTCAKISATLRKESPYKNLLAEMDARQGSVRWIV